MILEGVTGAGKSQTLAALRAHPAFPDLIRAGQIFFEEETLGELMDELQDTDVPPSHHCARLERVLQTVREAAAISGDYRYILERFHPSYYALLPDWNLYASIDRQLQALNCTIVLLSFQPGIVEPRALDRVDRRDAGWTEGMIDYFGSRTRAIEAIDLSQQRRRACLSLSGLPHHEIDTSAMDWRAYADEIVDLWRRVS